MAMLMRDILFDSARESVILKQIPPMISQRSGELLFRSNVEVNCWRKCNFYQNLWASAEKPSVEQMDPPHILVKPPNTSKSTQILRQVKFFDREVEKLTGANDVDVTDFFPFAKYFKVAQVTLSQARQFLKRIDNLFEELAEYRPFELLRSQRQRADYLITKQARIVAMTCTHAAIARSNLIELGFEYDNIVMEESGQVLEIETFIPFLLQSGKSDDSVSGRSRLKRVCLLGDPQSVATRCEKTLLSQSLATSIKACSLRLIRLGVPYIQLDKQGRARPELMQL